MLSRPTKLGGVSLESLTQGWTSLRRGGTVADRRAGGYAGIRPGGPRPQQASGMTAPAVNVVFQPRSGRRLPEELFTGGYELCLCKTLRTPYSGADF
jgi:hypothetical protein